MPGRRRIVLLTSASLSWITLGLAAMRTYRDVDPLIAAWSAGYRAGQRARIVADRQAERHLSIMESERTG